MTKTPQDIVLGELPDRAQVIATSIDHGRELLTTVDEFVKQQSRFDRQARVNLRREVVDVTRQIYLDYVASQVMPWSEQEIAALRGIVESVSSKFRRLNLPLPDRLFLVKTSGLEEGYAAYTRQLNVITLPANMVASLASAVNFGDPLHPASDVSYLENVVIHELFHIFSKNNPARRNELYRLVNYFPTGNDIELPGVSWPDGGTGLMTEMKITNPDTPALNVYIEMDVPAAPGACGETTPMRLTPLLLAESDYAGGIFFSYLKWWFMGVEECGDEWKPISGPGDRPVLYGSETLMPQYLELIGRNFSNELFHPDEIMAQSFVLVANEPNMKLLTGIDEVLASGGRLSSFRSLFA